MQHYVGLDVSVKETGVCIIDKAGTVSRAADTRPLYSRRAARPSAR
jgi:hypothetical protein